MQEQSHEPGSQIIPANVVLKVSTNQAKQNQWSFLFVLIDDSVSSSLATSREWDTLLFNRS